MTASAAGKVRRSGGQMAGWVLAFAGLVGAAQAQTQVPTPTPPSPSPLPQVQIAVSLSAEHVLKVSYTRPDGVLRLDFADTDPRSHTLYRSRLLSSLDQCAQIDAQGLQFDPRPACRTARFRIEPRVLAARAFYEPAQPFSDGSVLVHTRYLAATAPGAALVWRFIPPEAGYVVHEARLTRGPIVARVAVDRVDQVRSRLPGDNLEALVGRHYVFLGEAPVDSQAGLLFVRDPALQDSVWRDVEALASTAIGRYSAELGQPLKAPVAFILTQDAGLPNERPGMLGDVAAAQTIRLRFVRPSEQADEREVQTRREFIAHELAHLWNAGLFSSDQDAPWLHEGHAEWASRMMLAQAGLLDAERVREDLELAINRCALVRGQRSAFSLPPGWTSTDEPYACGMALHALAWAHARAVQPELGALAALARLHQALPHHDARSFARHFDGGATAGPLQHLLLDRDTPFATELLTQFARLGLPMQRRSDLQLDERLRQMVAIRLMSVIIERDCGAVRFRPGLDHVWIDPQLHCRSLPGGLRINSVEGAPMLVLPLRAWRSVGSACAVPGSGPGTPGAPAAPARQFHVGAYETTGFLLPCGDDFPAPPPLISLTARSVEWLGLAP